MTERIQDLELFLDKHEHTHATIGDLKAVATQIDKLLGLERPKASSAGFGFCPHCSSVVESRADGNDRCGKGHVFPSSAAISGPIDSVTR